MANKVTIEQRLKEIMKIRNINLSKLSDISKISKSSLHSYLQGKNEPKQNNIYRLARALNVSESYLMGWTEEIEQKHEIKTNSKGIQIPVLGTVPAGIPISAIEDIIDYEEIPRSWENQGEFFGLKIKGDSMYPTLENGDVVIVKKQSTADNGDTVIVMVNGDDATCKRYERSDTGIMLIPNNNAYSPIFYTNEEIESLPISIIGKVVELRRKF